MRKADRGQFVTPYMLYNILCIYSRTELLVTTEFTLEPLEILKLRNNRFTFNILKAIILSVPWRMDWNGEEVSRDCTQQC